MFQLTDLHILDSDGPFEIIHVCIEASEEGNYASVRMKSARFDYLLNFDDVRDFCLCSTDFPVTVTTVESLECDNADGKGRYLVRSCGAELFSFRCSSLDVSR